jgi:hypothetical protein
MQHLDLQIQVAVAAELNPPFLVIGLVETVGLEL